MTRAAEWITIADSKENGADTAGAIDALQRAASWHADQIGYSGQDDNAHARVCIRLADLLLTLDRLPEAIQAYQEAVDAFERVGDTDESRRYAREILGLTRQLWTRPQERLYLLIARMEREIRQLEEKENTERQRADLQFRIGTIFQRRDRFDESARHYQAALALFDRAGESDLELAACHHRIAGLYHYELEDTLRAEHHYREAIRLYEAAETAYDGEQMNRALCEQLLRQLLETASNVRRA